MAFAREDACLFRRDGERLQRLEFRRVRCRAGQVVGRNAACAAGGDDVAGRTAAGGECSETRSRCRAGIDAHTGELEPALAGRRTDAAPEAVAIDDVDAGEKKNKDVFFLYYFV